MLLTYQEYILVKAYVSYNNKYIGIIIFLKTQTKKNLNAEKNIPLKDKTIKQGQRRLVFIPVSLTVPLSHIGNSYLTYHHFPKNYISEVES